MDIQSLVERFHAQYGGDPVIYRAPGRVNLIGEHTDYNEGFVMPMAINFATFVAMTVRDDTRLIVRSENFEETVEFDLNDDDPQRRKHWSDYPRGVAYSLQRAGYRLKGANMLLHGEVPLGSGLSSSAAIEVGVGFALLDGADIEVDRLKLALACQRAENEFVGTRSGLMDQFIACFGKDGCALILDCRSLAYEHHPLRADEKVVVCNTMVKHELAAGEYNTRRAECEKGVRLLQQKFPDVKSLRDVTLQELQGIELPPIIYKRCHHVITENARVLAAAAALERADMTTFGELMYESHRSLRDEYEVSAPELDQMVELAKTYDGVYGARMTGGGFGGCTVNIVKSEAVEDFIKRIVADYEAATNIKPGVYVFTPSQGAERVT